MKIGIIILARMDSTRLPGKALIDIVGRSLIGRVIDICRQVKGVDPIVLATSDRPIDDPLAEIADQEGVLIYRGSVDDVAGRFLNAMRHFDLDGALRLNGDSPLNRPALLSQAVAIFREGGVDLVSNVPERTFPFGVSAEIIGRRAMELAYARMSDSNDREHVTSFFYRNPDLINIHPIRAEKPEFRGVNLALDQPLDVERISWIIRKVDDPLTAPLEQLTHLARDFDARAKQAIHVESSR
jgi:spore coat polysaccharide biosynthesis protein SpsF (cytidylyltransferase family)